MLPVAQLPGKSNDISVDYQLVSDVVRLLEEVEVSAACQDSGYCSQSPEPEEECEVGKAQHVESTRSKVILSELPARERI